MNEQTELMLRELAEKFGTTVAHLWGVLIKQAYISGVTDLIVYCFLLWVIRLAYNWAVKSQKEERDDLELRWLTFSVLGFLIAIMIMFSLSTTVGALLNPEYWAMNKILSY